MGARAVRFDGIAATFSFADNGRLIADGAERCADRSDHCGSSGWHQHDFNKLRYRVYEQSRGLDDELAECGYVDDNVLFAITMINRGPFDAINARWTNTFPVLGNRFRDRGRALECFNGGFQRHCNLPKRQHRRDLYDAGEGQASNSG